ncbi:SEC-C domain-containing protein [Lysinibacillus sp. NPDC056232]|uniref:SEC-C domain-containing protein n=1 Tax=Lysinibacillus sp. NPDC056232 TaxID=3345756 RepID=UPI0035DB891D
MKIERNEKCPCGSGKKFKHCCIDNLKYTQTQSNLNNGLPRKYMSEFALHTYSSTVAICYPNDLDKVDVSNTNYHIYMIHEIPRLSFVKDGIKIFDTHVEILIQVGVVEDVSIKKIEIQFIEGNHKEFFTYELIGNKGLILRDVEGGGIQTDILCLYTNFYNERLKSKILYVGQSYGKAGERDAIQRLGSHSTLQKILADVSHRNIEVEVAISLWEFTPRLFSSFDGISKNYLTTESEDLEHLAKVMSNPPLRIDNQIINVTEAGLINYFKPEYNEKFKNNFPDIDHKGYKFYYSYDYNAIEIELDPSCINIEIFSETHVYSQWRPIKFNLHSENERRSIFDIDFSNDGL